MENPYDQVALRPGRLDQALDPIGDVGVVDDAPVGPHPEGLLDVDDDQRCSTHASILADRQALAEGTITAGGGRIWS
jgi:hypothetical protein